MPLFLQDLAQHWSSKTIGKPALILMGSYKWGGYGYKVISRTTMVITYIRGSYKQKAIAIVILLINLVGSGSFGFVCIANPSRV